MLEGRVRWFCNTSGEGMISATDGKSYYVSWGSVLGKFPPKHNKASWVEMFSGQGVTFEIVCNQAHNVTITDDTRSIPAPSMYIDRPLMKAKLAAAKAMFAETFPENRVNWDEYRKLSNSSKKLTDKQKNKVAKIEEEIKRHNLQVKEHNAELSALLCSIYREHSTFDPLRGLK